MKRSEALEIIEKTIRESSPAFPYDRALAVLDALEKAGMLPPRNSIPYNFHVHNDPHDYKDYLHDWDKE